MVESQPVSFLTDGSGVLKKSTDGKKAFGSAYMERLYNEYCRTRDRILNASSVNEQGDSFHKSAADDITEKIRDLQARAEAGDLKAIEELIMMSRGQPCFKEMIDKILETLAAKGDASINTVLFNQAGHNEKVLAALIYNNSEHAQAASEKLTSMIDIDPKRRMISMQHLVIPYTPELESLLLENLKKDVEKNIDLIGKFKYTLNGVSTLADIAINKPTTIAGNKAAVILGDSFVNGDQKTSTAALRALETSASNGNKEALNSLAKAAANDNSIRAFRAIDVLAKLATSGSQSGTSDSALGKLLNLAKDKKVSSKTRNYVINKLGEISSQSNKSKITDTLINIAREPGVGNQARNVLFKLAEHNPEILNKSIGLLSDVARGNLPGDSKFAIKLLGKAVKSGTPSAIKARETLDMVKG